MFSAFGIVRISQRKCVKTDYQRCAMVMIAWGNFGKNFKYFEELNYSEIFLKSAKSNNFRNFLKNFEFENSEFYLVSCTFWTNSIIFCFSKTLQNLGFLNLSPPVTCQNRCLPGTVSEAPCLYRTWSLPDSVHDPFSV